MSENTTVKKRLYSSTPSSSLCLPAPFLAVGAMRQESRVPTGFAWGLWKLQSLELKRWLLGRAGQGRERTKVPSGREQGRGEV